MAEFSKRSSKDELLEAAKKWHKRATDSESRRRALEDSNQELQSRLDGLQLQVELYKERDQEASRKIREAQEATGEAEIAQAQLESLNLKAAQDDEALKALTAQLKLLTSENETLKAAAVSNTAALSAVTTSDDPITLRAALQKAELRCHDLQTATEEYQTRIANLMKSHEAFIEQSRSETDAEIAARVESSTAEMKQERERWMQDRAAMIEGHMRQQEELQMQYDELKDGLEKSEAWTARDKEASRLKDELAKLTANYNAQAERMQEIGTLKHEITLRDELITTLRDQSLELESEIADTRVLCMQALKEAAAGHGSAHGQGTPSKGQDYRDGSSVASSSSVSPPPSPKERDLFDFAVSGKAKSRREAEVQKQLARYKSKVKSEEQARQRNMDEVESYRADYLNALVTELEGYRKAATQKTEGDVPAEVIRLRGEFQREREAWEMEKLELEKQVDLAKKAHAEPAANGASEEKLQRERDEASLEKELLEKELEETVASHEVKEEILLAKIARMKEQIQSSEEKGRELTGRFKEMEAQVAVSLQGSQKLREAEDRIIQLTAEIEAMHAANHSGSSDNPSLGSLPVFLRPGSVRCASPPLSLSPPPDETHITKEALEAERKIRLEALRTQLRSISSDG